jgi:spore germination protein KB
MRVEKFDNRQLFFIIIIMRVTVAIATLPLLTSADALQDAWASSLLLAAASVLLVLIIAGLGRCFPRLTVIEISQKLLGKVGGTLLSFLILWSFLHLASFDVRLYSEMIIAGFLPETPISFITASVVLVAVAAALAGIEVIGRLADIIFPLFLAMLLFSIISLFLEAEFTLLQPVLARGFLPVLRGSVVPTAMAAQLLVVGMLIPQLTEPQGAVRSVFWSILAASFLILGVTVLTVSILGPDEGARTVFPFFKAIRNVQISEFLERIEVLAIFAWGLGLFVSLATFIYCGAQGTAQVFRVSDYRYLLLPMGVTWVVITIHNFANVFELRSFFSPQYLGVYGISLVAVPYGLLWAAYAVRRLLGQDPARGGRQRNDE